MVEKLKKVLPFIAGLAALVALLASLVLGPWLGRRALLADRGETRSAVEAAVLIPLQALRPASVDDASLREAVSRARSAPYVARVWLFAADGRVLEGNRSMAQGTVEASATDEMRRVLGMLPEGALSAEQRRALLAASAMQKEGEHNDIWRHLLREVRGPGGELVAWVGLTYDVSPAISAPPLSYKLFVLALLLSMGLYWVSLPGWVWLDARAGGERAWAWAAFVLLGNLVALIAYLLVRVPASRNQAAL